METNMSNKESKYVVVCTYYKFYEDVGRDILDQQFVEFETYEEAVQYEKELRLASVDQDLETWISER